MQDEQFWVMRMICYFYEEHTAAMTRQSTGHAKVPCKKRQVKSGERGRGWGGGGEGVEMSIKPLESSL